MGPSPLMRENCPLATTNNDGLMSSAQAASVATLATDVEAMTDPGAFAATKLTMSAQPTDGKVFVLDGHTFEFRTSLYGPDTVTQVLTNPGVIPTDEIMGYLADAISGVSNPNVVPADPPFTGPFTAFMEPSGGNVMYLFQTTAQGAEPVPTTPSSITMSTDVVGAVLSTSNMNQTAGAAEGTRPVHRGTFTVTSGMRSSGQYNIFLPFVPVSMVFTVQNGGSVVSRTPSITYSTASFPAYPQIAGQVVVFTPANVAPALQVNDIVSFVIFGAVG